MLWVYWLTAKGECAWVRVDWWPARSICGGSNMSSCWRPATYSVEITVERDRLTGETKVLSTNTLLPKDLTQQGVKVYEDDQKGDSAVVCAGESCGRKPIVRSPSALREVPVTLAGGRRSKRLWRRISMPKPEPQRSRGKCVRKTIAS